MRSLIATWLTLLFAFTTQISAAAPPSAVDRETATRAVGILRTHCYRCHGQDGAVEGGLNYILDVPRLIARRKIVPGQPEKSPLYVRTAKGKMPPPDEPHRPTADEIVVLQKWIQSGAGVPKVVAQREFISENQVQEWMLADLDQIDRRARRFVRYFSLVTLANAGATPDEIQTYRHAVSKLINSLSWHPRITIPRNVGPEGLLLRIDLREYLLDANLWNRLLNEYPYGVLHDSAISRAVMIHTATRMPMVRADWFVANASRAPLYYDLLQIPSNLADLERQLRVDVAANLLQDRVARAGFNGSGISRNNRILERHDAMNGAYWRTYDFEAVPQNLIERNILAPDRRNLFAYPLGPGGAETNFQHAGGEVIFNLPNGLHGFMLINANNQRINKGPTEIVSDAKRPDRAVEAGLSCMHCHARGIIPKDDQIRDHVLKNRKAFSRTDIDLVEGQYIPAKKMRQLMEEDALRFQKAVEKTGNKANAAEVVLAMTLRYEADVDLPTLAAEVGVKPEIIQAKLTNTENIARNLGALKVVGGTVSRQVVIQAFGDLVRELKIGTVLEIGRQGETLPDATGEADPLEAQSSRANAMDFSPDGKFAVFASADRSVILFDIEANREIRRFIGHTASVWAVAYSPDGKQLLSGGKDGSVRLWEVETGRELHKFDAHFDLVSAVAFSPDGKRAVSAGFDHEIALWDLTKLTRIAGFVGVDTAKYIQSLRFSPDGKQLLVAGERTLCLLDALTGRVVRRLNGHTGWINQVVFSADGKQALTASDDGTARLWNLATGEAIKSYKHHLGAVKSAAISPDGRFVVTAGIDTTVRLIESATGREIKAFGKHKDSLTAVTFGRSGRYTLSGTRTGEVEPWNITKLILTLPKPIIPTPTKIIPYEDRGSYAVLRPDATIAVGGTMSELFLSPDNRYLYYLNRTENKLGRIETGTLLRSELTLRANTETVAMSPDGKILIGLWSGKDKSERSELEWIDATNWIKKDQFSLPWHMHDLVVTNEQKVYLTGRGNRWSNVQTFDLKARQQGTQLGRIWGNSLLHLAPGGQSLYVSSQQAVPGTIERFTLTAGAPVRWKPSNLAKVDLGGSFRLTPDGQYLVMQNGAILQLADGISFFKRIESHLSLAVDVEGKAAYVIRTDGLLVRYSYPDFIKVGMWRPTLAAYRVAVDGKAGKLYVAGFDPRAMVENPRAKGHGDVHVYLIGEMSKK